MMGPSHNQEKIPRVKVTLDGQLVTLPSQFWGSITGIRAYLEMLALRQRRLLHTLLVDGVPFNVGITSRLRSFRSIAASTIGFDQLPLQLLSVAREQVNQLIGRVRSLVLTVVINDWAVAQEIWWKLLPDLKEPLLTLHFFPKICAAERKDISQALASHLDKLGQILAKLDHICIRRDQLALSDAFERSITPWLEEVKASLENWHQSCT
jgi:hypothetical protein